MASTKTNFPPQHQDTLPGKQYLMYPLPETINPDYKPSNKLQGKIALVTGGDSGIGRSVGYYFSIEGATVAFTYVKGIEDQDKDDALELFRKSKAADAKDPIAIAVDFQSEAECKKVIDKVVSQYGRIDILVNNAGTQIYKTSIEEITEENLLMVFRVNIFAQIFMCKHALKYMKEGSSIINTSSALAYVGSGQMVDYSATKAAIVNFTRSMALQLMDRKIRVNSVAPGPCWTPLQPASLPCDMVANLGNEAPMLRAAQPYEIAASYVFLASNDFSSYITGQVVHPNGGMFVSS